MIRTGLTGTRDFGYGSREFMKQILDYVSVNIPVVGLVSILEQAVITCGGANCGSQVFAGRRIEVTCRQRRFGDFREGRWIFRDLAKYARSSFRCFVEKQNSSFIETRKRVNGKLI